MFAVLFDTKKGKSIKIFPTLEDARAAALDAVGKGNTITIYDYDIASETFFEFCEAQ